MCALRRKPLFSISHHLCAWANSPWPTKRESNSFGRAAKKKWSQILSWKRRTQLWWRCLVDRRGFFEAPFLPLFSPFSILPWVIPTEGPSSAKAGVWWGEEMNVVFPELTGVGSSRVHGGVTARAQLPRVLKLDLTPCLLWRWNPWQVIILLSHIISDALSTSLPAKSQLLGSGKKERRSSESPDVHKPGSGRLRLSPELSLGFIAKQGMQVF